MLNSFLIAHTAWKQNTCIMDGTEEISVKICYGNILPRSRFAPYPNIISFKLFNILCYLDVNTNEVIKIQYSVECQSESTRIRQKMLNHTFQIRAVIGTKKYRAPKQVGAN